MHKSVKLKLYSQGLFTLKLLAKYQETFQSTSKQFKGKRVAEGQGETFTLEGQLSI